MHKNPLCQSIFKDGTKETTPQAVTQIWAVLLHRLECSHPIFPKNTSDGETST